MKDVRILKGCHYSNMLPRISLATSIETSRSMYADVIFTDSCAYKVDEPSLVNKLFGFCFNFGVHKNSVRIGWTYVEELASIYIYAYIYENGVLHKTHIGSCNLNTKHTYKIYFDTKRVVATILIDGEEKYKHIFSDSVKLPCFYTTLTPYFGGNTRAPHTIHILIDSSVNKNTHT